MVKKIMIDAGHGGRDPGACAGDLRESDLNLKVALAARAALAAYDCQVFMTRTADTNSRINDNTALAKKLGVSAYVAVHHNAGGGQGSEVFYWQGHGPSKALAEELLAQFVALGQKSRGVKASSLKAYNFGVCRINAASSIPAVLGEYAFMDNSKDRQALDSDKKLEAQGQAYAKALVKFLNLKKKQVPQAAPPLENKPVKIKAGAALNFKRAQLFTASDSNKAVGRVSGKYYLYDGKEIRGRYRITNSPANVGRLPVGRYVTGWVKKEDLPLA
ncbi:MAG: N-acetylmuramoyl-L-alanine amidase [Clostridiales bacterium]|nr:N-acetylmuramoyl-L-alanine amidase [Clostridiales bacterium]